MTKLYIITPNYNGITFLKEYFNSLFNQTFTDFTIIFIDNASEDNSVEFIKENYGDKLENKIMVIKNRENYGFAKASNQGLEKAFEDEECEYALCLNNDTKATPDFLKELINCAERHQNVGAVQAKIIKGFKSNIIDSTGLEYSKNGLGFDRGAYGSINKYNKEEEVFGGCAAACLYKKDALNDVSMNGQYFDDDFFAYYEDFDLSFRLRWAGWSVWFCPKAIVNHHRGGTGGSNISSFTVYHMWRNYTWVLFKNLPLSYILKHFYLILLCELSQIGISLLRKRPVIIKAKIDAYADIGIFLDKNKRINKNVDFKEIEKWFVNRWRPEIPENYEHK